MEQEVTISISLNGEPKTFRSHPDLPLLYALRDILGARATRFGCGEGTCGACTVLVNDVPVMSCDTPVGTIEGASVETAEGLDKGTQHPVLKALLDHQAGQCGYCLPGVAMRGKHLFDTGAAPDRAAIAAALDDHLCRCGSHNRVLDALEQALGERSQR